MTLLSCRFCRSPLEHTFVDLGMSPLSNANLRADQLDDKEIFYPLHARVCGVCFLVQLGEFERPETIFANYPYFSSFSDTWLRHARDYATQMIDRCRLNSRSLVMEVASNDGYLLQYFRTQGVPVLGIEPAQNVASEAEKKGITTIPEFFGSVTARKLEASGRQADLLIGNNVLAHVPDLNDFVAGLKIALKPHGIITMEFPHLLCLIENNQFDTIYHEHFSYFSFSTAEQIFRSHALTVFDVEEIPTHGGSLRVYAGHAETPMNVELRVTQLRQREREAGICNLDTYCRFAARVQEAKRALLEFLISVKRAGKSIVGYGAPAKGNTLLNYCGIGKDFLDYTVDLSHHKQGQFLPGTHIPIYQPDMIRRTQPDYVLILPWNLRDEILDQLAYVSQWGGRFVIPIPTVEVIK